MPTISGDELLASTTALAPLIREHAAHGERERRLAPAALQAMSSAGLFRMLAPRALGGLEVDPLTCARVIEKVAEADSSAAWVLGNANSVAWWCGRLPAAGVEDIYAAGPDALIAAAFHPPVEAVAVDGGFRLTGRRPLASGIHDSAWLMLSAIVVEDGEPRAGSGGPEVIAAFVATQAVEIIDTWDALGMRGTDSNDVAVHDVFVPASRTYRLVPEAPLNALYQRPLYRLSAMAEVSAISAPVFLGIARQALDALRDLAQGKTPFGSTKVLAQQTLVQAQVARAAALLRSGRLLLHESLAADWQRACRGESASLEAKADALLAAVHAVDASVEAVDAMHALAGTTGIYARDPIERHFRDVHTLRHHGFVTPRRYETVGQVYLGVPPEFALVAF
jgi:alkylation response protein AidB-like acyl-CoA dehydrogenase